MDRQFDILLDSYLFATFTFSYEGKNSGQVEIKTFRAEPVDGSDIKSVVPVALYKRAFVHDALDSIDAVYSYDQEFGMAEFGESEEYQAGNKEYFYRFHESHLRYYITGSQPANGVVDIFASFPENKKRMHFTSIFRKTDDLQMSSDSLETNVDLISRFLEELLAGGDHTSVEIREVY